MKNTKQNSQKINMFFLLFFLFNLNSLKAQLDSSDFVATYQTSIFDAFVSDSSFRILTDTNYSYNYDLDWDNDGIFDTLGLQGDYLLTYDSIGIYTIRIRGEFPRLFVSRKIIDVNQWGDNAWKNMEYGFSYSQFLQFSAIDSPNLDSVTSLEGLFYNSNFNGIVNHWDVSKIQNMSKMFRSTQNFNAPISNWDVSSVTDMSYMFSSANVFNQPIGNWDVSSVTNMDRMFSYSNFNHPLANWNVSSVKSMNLMFSSSPFNFPIDSWDVSSVESMIAMFSNCLNFNQSLNNWDVSSVKSMRRIFRDASAFNRNISSWTTDSVIDMSQMFYNSVFNNSLNNWDVSNVENFSNMFSRSQFNQNINNWNVSSAKYMDGMFSYTFSYNQPLSNWNVSNVTSMNEMFRNAFSFNQDLSSWNLDSINGYYSLRFMFDNSALSVSNYDATLNLWSTKSFNDSILIGVQGLEYCGSQIARNSLINRGWIFQGDNLQLGCTLTRLDNEPEEALFLLNVFPTTTEGPIKVEIKNRSKFEYPIIIFDDKGRLILMEEVTGTVKEFNISNLSNGLYLVKYGSETKKVLLQR